MEESKDLNTPSEKWFLITVEICHDQSRGKLTTALSLLKHVFYYGKNNATASGGSKQNIFL